MAQGMRPYPQSSYRVTLLARLVVGAYRLHELQEFVEACSLLYPLQHMDDSNLLITLFETQELGWFDIRPPIISGTSVCPQAKQAIFDGCVDDLT